MGIIYSILNKANGKIYVGQTERPASIRRTEHFSELRTQTHTNPYLQKSWNKYGEDSFVFNILEHCDDSKLGENEDWWIKYFDSENRDKGYNLQSGGLVGYTRSKEFGKKISERLKGVPRSEETKLKISLSNSGMNNPFYGETHSLETKLRLSKIRNNSGYYRVTKEKKDDVKQGFIWRYSWRENGKQKKFTSVSLDKLRKKVIDNGLDWYCLNEVSA